MRNFIVFILLVFSFALVQTNAQAQTDTTFTLTTSANPFDDQVTLYINPGNKNITSIRIFDAIHKEVTMPVDFSASPKTGPTAITLDFSGFKPGLYFCTIYSDKGILETRRLFFRAAR